MTISFCRSGLGVTVLMLRHYTHKTVLAWAYRSIKIKIITVHFSLFHVPGDESVAFNQNSGDTVVLLKK